MEPLSKSIPNRNMYQFIYPDENKINPITKNKIRSSIEEPNSVRIIILSNYFFKFERFWTDDCKIPFIGPT
jgi:hypothetical protein